LRVQLILRSVSCKLCLQQDNRGQGKDAAKTLTKKLCKERRDLHDSNQTLGSSQNQRRQSARQIQATLPRANHKEDSGP